VPDRDQLRQRLSSALGQLYSRFPALARIWGGNYTARSGELVPLAPMRKPLRSSRLALVTTGGVHLRTQAGFDMLDSRGDASYRAIPPEAPAAALTITHDYYNHSDADKDLNILFPLSLMRELAARGAIGGLGTSYGFMGHIEPPHDETLLRRTGPEVARLLRHEQIDAVLLTPA
jgi:D-proline reductase (dithiol) PrdB